MVLLLSSSLLNILGAFNCFILSFIYSSFSKSFKAVQLTGNSNLFLYVSSKEEMVFINSSSPLFLKADVFIIGTPNLLESLFVSISIFKASAWSIILRAITTFAPISIS